MRKLSPEEVQEKINSFDPSIKLIKESYINMTSKAQFTDPIYGTWQCCPKDLIKNRKNPNKAKNKKLSPEEVQKRLDLLGTGIKLKFESYKSQKYKCIFIDPEFGDWEGWPENVLRGAKHPERRSLELSKNMTLPASTISDRLKNDPRNISLKEDTYVNITTKATFIDPKYGEWEAIPDNVLAGKSHPNNTHKQTAIEKIFETATGITWVGNKQIIEYPLKPDFIYNNLCFNVDGLYWHSNLSKSNQYHYKLRKLYESRGYRLLQFREDEILYKLPIVLSITNNVLGKTFTKYARNCEIKEINAQESFDFFETNHLMGGIRKSSIALISYDTILCMISYSIRNNTLKVERFCNSLNTSVVGGYSKLLNYLTKKFTHIKEIHSWVDLRYGNGKSLEKIGFVKTKEVLSWKWADIRNKRTYNRLRCRANMDHRNLTEKEYAAELGWVKIYDAGQALFIKQII